MSVLDLCSTQPKAFQTAADIGGISMYDISIYGGDKTRLTKKERMRRRARRMIKAGLREDHALIQCLKHLFASGSVPSALGFSMKGQGFGKTAWRRPGLWLMIRPILRLMPGAWA
ncbi:unnamed protein product [Anisakis simplex]|uniref:Transposase n=1 Tax=Anisakis simplex TaxID=6269 RepID=A0A0M3JW15_ANISI|nr:unnamed protein product [Anisakis simplex]